MLKKTNHTTDSGSGNAPDKENGRNKIRQLLKSTRPKEDNLSEEEMEEIFKKVMRHSDKEK